MRHFLKLLLFLLICGPGAADGIRIKLHNGDVISGTIVREDANMLVLKSPFGLLNIPKAAIKSRTAQGDDLPPIKPRVGPDKPVKPPIERSRSIDKQTLGQIQGLMSRLQDAINRGEGAALSACLHPAPKERLQLEPRKDRLGIRRVLVRAIHGRRKGSGPVLATVNVTAFGPKGDAHVRGEEFSLIEQGGVWKVALPPDDVPKILGRIAKHETAAIAMLRTIHTAQAAFIKRKVVDIDKDGLGEYGFLQELAGARLRGPRGKPRQPIDALIDESLGRSFTLLRSFGLAGGYHFIIYLPGDSKAVHETGPLPAWLPVHSDRAEVQYVCYAWPARYGLTGQRAFVIDRAGTIYFTTSGRYFGANPPAPEAAFSRKAFAPKNLLTDPRYGLARAPTCDSQLWLPLGEPFARSLPPGPRRRIHLVQRLLLADVLYPEGPIGGKVKRKEPVKRPGDKNQQRQRIAQAQREVNALVLALHAYRARKRRFPPGGGNNLLAFLDGDPRNGGPSELYFVFPKERVVDGRLLDPWAQPYRYAAPSRPSDPPRVWSVGPDRRDNDGKSDDILGK